MQSLRRLVFHNRGLACWLVAAALLLRILMPAGFMPGMSGGMMTVTLCTGQGLQTMLVEAPGNGQPHDDGMHKKGDMPCAFSGLSAPVLGGVDPILLVIAIAFIVATGFRGAARIVTTIPDYLRPPSHGPPAAA